MIPELEIDDPLAAVDTERALMENPEHEAGRSDIKDGLRARFRDREGVRVMANLAVQYDERDRRKLLSPDVFVALSVAADAPPVERSWQTWVHGAPTVVFEVASESTVASDLGRKPRTYVAMGVEEYFVFDPLWRDPERALLPEPLLGWRREDGRLVQVPRADGYESPLLGLRLQVIDGRLRFRDLVSSRLIEIGEEKDARIAEQDRRIAEQDRRIAEQDRRIADLERRLSELGRAPG